MSNDEQKAIAEAIDRLTERLVAAKDAELAHLRELNGTLTSISTYVNQLLDVHEKLLERFRQ